MAASEVLRKRLYALHVEIFRDNDELVEHVPDTLLESVVRELHRAAKNSSIVDTSKLLINLHC